MYALGDTKAIDVDIRIIAATNRDIRQSLKEKKFREDLFFRLGEFSLPAPSVPSAKRDCGD